MGFLKTNLPCGAYSNSESRTRQKVVSIQRIYNRRLRNQVRCNSFLLLFDRHRTSKPQRWNYPGSSFKTRVNACEGKAFKSGWNTLRPRYCEGVPASMRPEAILVAIADYLTAKDFVDLGYLEFIDDPKLKEQLTKNAANATSLFDSDDWTEADDLARRSQYERVADKPKLIDARSVRGYAPDKHPY